MEEQLEYRGFVVTVTARSDRAGGSRITLMIERPPKVRELRVKAPDPKPEHYHSHSIGKAAVGEAMDRAKRAIDNALGPRNPFED